jgi:hypothetical protein
VCCWWKKTHLPATLLLHLQLVLWLHLRLLGHESFLASMAS